MRLPWGNSTMRVVPERYRSSMQIPDAQAVLEYQEILELPQLTGVIYLASVVKEVGPYQIPHFLNSVLVYSQHRLAIYHKYVCSTASSQIQQTRLL